MIKNKTQKGKKQVAADIEGWKGECALQIVENKL